MLYKTAFIYLLGTFRIRVKSLYQAFVAGATMIPVITTRMRQPSIKYSYAVAWLDSFTNKMGDKNATGRKNPPASLSHKERRI